MPSCCSVGCCCCCRCCCHCRCCVTDCPSILLRAPASGCTRSRSTEKDSSSIVVCRAHRASLLFRDAGACSQFGHVMSYHGYGVVSQGGDVASQQCRQDVRDCTELYRTVSTVQDVICILLSPVAVSVLLGETRSPCICRLHTSSSAPSEPLGRTTWKTLSLRVQL